MFDVAFARTVAKQHCDAHNLEPNLVSSFVGVCFYISEHPKSLSWRGKSSPDIATKEGVESLAEKYFSGYRQSDFPVEPGTTPDQIVSSILQAAYGYPADVCERIQIEHQHAMSAENCVGALLERYLDSVLRPHGWFWCCGNFVRAIDFVKKTEEGEWMAIQIKNRDNSENSSSSAIREGTGIQKWFRFYSKTGRTNWKNLPLSMQGVGLSEEGFIEFVRNYLRRPSPES